MKSSTVRPERSNAKSKGGGPPAGIPPASLASTRSLDRYFEVPEPLELPVELPALPVLPGERCGAVGAPGLLGLGALGLEGEADRSAGALPGAPLVRGLLP